MKCGCWTKNNGKTPQIIHLYIGFFHEIFTIHFGVFLFLGNIGWIPPWKPAARGLNQNVLVFLPVGNVLAWWAFQRTMSLPISTVSWRIWMVRRWFEGSLSLWKSVETEVIWRFFSSETGVWDVFFWGGGIELRRLDPFGGFFLFEWKIWSTRSNNFIWCSMSLV